MIFKRAAFNPPYRHLIICRSDDNEGLEIASVDVGLALSQGSKVQPIVRSLSDEKVTLEWYNEARLDIEAIETEARWSEYCISWTPLRQNFIPVDALTFNGQWYGGGQCFEQRWPSSLQRSPMQNYVSNVSISGLVISLISKFIFQKSKMALLFLFWYACYGTVAAVATTVLEATYRHDFALRGTQGSAKSIPVAVYFF